MPITLTWVRSLHQGPGYTCLPGLTDYSTQPTELLVNNNVIYWIYFNSNDSVDGSVTGTAVVQVNQGDDVLIRTGSRFHTGTIKSDHDGKSSFAGWILM